MHFPPFRKNCFSENQMTADCLVVTKTDSVVTMTKSTSHVHYCKALSSPNDMLSGGFRYSDSLLFADDIQLFREMKSPHDSVTSIGYTGLLRSP